MKQHHPQTSATHTGYTAYDENQQPVDVIITETREERPQVNAWQRRIEEARLSVHGLKETAAWKRGELHEIEYQIKLAEERLARLERFEEEPDEVLRYQIQNLFTIWNESSDNARRALLKCIGSSPYPETAIAHTR
jgi:hypothetical protein